MEAGFLFPKIIFGRPTSGSFGLLAERLDHPGQSASSWRGLGSHVSGALCEPSMPMLTRMPLFVENVVLLGFSFAPPDLFLEGYSLLAEVVVLEEGFPTLNGCDSPGMSISRPCLPVKDTGLQDLKIELFKNISLWEEVVVLKGPC